MNLVFDQLTYKLSDQVFTYYKHLAARYMLGKIFAHKRSYLFCMPYHHCSVHVSFVCSIYLDRQFKSAIEKAGLRVPYPPRNRYSTLLKQRSIKVRHHAVLAVWSATCVVSYRLIVCTDSNHPCHSDASSVCACFCGRCWDVRLT